MLRSAAGIMGSHTPKIVADVARPYQNRLCQSKMIDLERVFPLLCSLKCHCFCGRQFTICTELYDCSLFEMLRERAFLNNSAASHVESDSHCERTACVTKSIFCMSAEKTLMRP